MESESLTLLAELMTRAPEPPSTWPVPAPKYPPIPVETSGDPFDAYVAACKRAERDTVIDRDLSWRKAWAEVFLATEPTGVGVAEGAMRKIMAVIDSSSIPCCNPAPTWDTIADQAVKELHDAKRCIAALMKISGAVDSLPAFASWDVVAEIVVKKIAGFEVELERIGKILGAVDGETMVQTATRVADALKAIDPQTGHRTVAEGNADRERLIRNTKDRSIADQIREILDLKSDDVVAEVRALYLDFQGLLKSNGDWKEKIDQLARASENRRQRADDLEKELREAIAAALKCRDEAIKSESETITKIAKACGWEGAATQFTLIQHLEHQRECADRQAGTIRTLLGSELQKQRAIEILGGAIVKIIPDGHASGDVVEHATKTAENLLARWNEQSETLARFEDAEPHHNAMIQRVAALEKEIEAVVAKLPADVVVHVREGAGPEDVAATLAVSVANLKKKRSDLEQTVCDFQAASMLDVGGYNGPCAVRPEHVEKHIIKLRSRIDGLVKAGAHVIDIHRHDPPIEDPQHAAAVRALGDRIGYGAMMSSAEAAWRDILKTKHPGTEGGEYTAGPCRAVLDTALGAMRAAIEAAETADALASDELELERRLMKNSEIVVVAGGKSIVGPGQLAAGATFKVTANGKAFEIPDEEIHPNGRCTCAGEGRCEWCLKTDQVTGAPKGGALEVGRCLKEDPNAFGASSQCPQPAGHSGGCGIKKTPVGAVSFVGLGPDVEPSLEAVRRGVTVGNFLFHKRVWGDWVLVFGPTDYDRRASINPVKGSLEDWRAMFQHWCEEHPSRSAGGGCPGFVYRGGKFGWAVRTAAPAGVAFDELAIPTSQARDLAIAALNLIDPKPHRAIFDAASGFWICQRHGALDECGTGHRSQEQAEKHCAEIDAPRVEINGDGSAAREIASVPTVGLARELEKKPIAKVFSGGWKLAEYAPDLWTLTHDASDHEITKGITAKTETWRCICKRFVKAADRGLVDFSGIKMHAKVNGGPWILETNPGDAPRTMAAVFFDDARELGFAFEDLVSKRASEGPADGGAS